MTTKVEGNDGREISKIEEGVGAKRKSKSCASHEVVTILQKLIAEVIGTYFINFAGCGSVAVNVLYGGNITFLGICVIWGLICSVMIYSFGHVSGAHFNPAVSVTFALLGRFPWKEVPLYTVAHVTGSILASVTIVLMFDITPEAFFGTVPAGSDMQSFVIEILISFLLMIVISGVGTDDRATNHLSGFAVGITIMINVLVAGPISGASMNPARTIGPAVVRHVYKGIWVYMVGPPIGIIAGGFAYNLMRSTS